MAKAKKPIQREKVETLHHLISSLTYRASVGRTLLFTVILGPFFVYSFAIFKNIVTPDDALTQSIPPLLIVSLMFFIYDFLYVSVAYKYPLSRIPDKVTLFAVELGILVLLLLPLVWHNLSSKVTALSTISLLATTPVFVLMVRALMGLRAAQQAALRRRK